MSEKTTMEELVDLFFMTLQKEEDQFSIDSPLPRINCSYELRHIPTDIKTIIYDDRLRGDLKSDNKEISEKMHNLVSKIYETRLETALEQRTLDYLNKLKNYLN